MRSVFVKVAPIIVDFDEHISEEGGGAKEGEDDDDLSVMNGPEEGATPTEANGANGNSGPTENQ